MGNGLASAAHQDHRRQRLVMQPAFRHEHLRGYVAVMRQEITAVMESWHDGDSVDLVEEMFTLTTTIALRADRGDLMSRLLAARDEEDHGLSDTELADQIAVLMLAGGETTSAAVTWSWHLLTTHPEILVAVQAETDESSIRETSQLS